MAVLCRFAIQYYYTLMDRFASASHNTFLADEMSSPVQACCSFNFRPVIEGKVPETQNMYITSCMFCKMDLYTDDRAFCYQVPS